MKTALLSLLLLFVGMLEGKSQDAPFQEPTLYKDLGLIVGYNNNFEFSKSGRYHLLEVGIMKSKYVISHHPASYSIYFSNEVGINTRNFVWGPKAGAYVAFWLFLVGTETIYYTDFREASLRVAPYLGYGAHQFKLSVNPHIIVTNKNFPIHAVNFNLTIKPYVFKKQKID